MLKEERQQLILEKLGTDKKVTLVELGQLLNVSYDSVRRDVIELEDRGLLKKVHGGAIANSYLSMKASRGLGIANNEFNNAKGSKQELQIAIKGDAKEEYPVIKKVMDILQDQHINSFSLVTGLRGKDF